MCSTRSSCSDEDPEGIILAKTKTVPGKADNARRTGLKHLNHHAGAQAQFFQAMHVVRKANQFANLGNFALGKQMQWNQVGHGGGGGSRMRLYLNKRMISSGQVGDND